MISSTSPRQFSSKILFENMADIVRPSARIAVILIDLQKGFISGRWMQSCGESDVTVIKSVFSKCGQVLYKLSHKIPVLLTRCMFSQKQDREFVEEIAQCIEKREFTHVIKPNTNILDYDFAVVEKWIQDITTKKIQTVVIGGCTTTSCVRVSSVNLQRQFSEKYNVEFIVDLNLCGARNSNYIKRCKDCLTRYMMGKGADNQCNGCKTVEGDGEFQSPVDNAVKDMKEAGVTVVNEFDWSEFMQGNIP